MRPDGCRENSFILDHGYNKTVLEAGMARCQPIYYFLYNPLLNNCSKPDSTMKHLERAPKQISGKKITYSAVLNEKSPKHARQANEFELIYKIKNRQNQYQEESFQSMILLKSKNKIKRYPDLGDRDRQKQKDQESNIKEVFDKINRKIQEHSKKTSPRLINLLSMSSNSPRSNLVNESKLNSNRIKKGSRNRMENNITNRANAIRSQKSLKKPKKSLESQRDAPAKHSSTSQTPVQYILFDNEIHPIAQQTHKNLTSLMRSTYDKSKLSLDHLQSQESGFQQEEFDVYERSAVLIQKAWRGHQTRKQLRKMKTTLSNHFSNLRVQTSVNGMFVQLFEEIADLDQEEMKIQLLKSFRQVLNNRCSVNSKSQNQEGDIIVGREDAIEAEFQAHSSILKCLLLTRTITNDEYSSKVDQLTKWGTAKREEISKLHRYVQQMKIKTKEIIEETQELNQVLESVQLLKSSPAILLKFFQKVEKQNLTHSFYENQPTRQPSVAKHIPTEPLESADVKSLVQQLENRQKLKSQIQRRMLQQLGYYQAEVSPVNSTNIGIHQFLTEILSYVQEYYKQDFLRWINMPYGYSPEYRLKLLQGYEMKDAEDCYGMVEGMQNVLSLQILLQYHKEAYTHEGLYNVYHERAVFDAFNECLNVYRPYFSIKGPPYLWNNSEKALTFYYIAEQNIEEVFEKTRQQVLKHASTLCGVLSNEADTPQQFQDLMGLKHKCHETLASYRDEKLERMESQSILSTEGQWGLIEQQRTQTMLNVSELVLSSLMKEMADEIRTLRR